MSYDLRFAVKGIDERMYVVFEPDLHSPTYSLRTLFRKCMDWDFKQGEYYAVKDVLPMIERGIDELSFNSERYERYEPANGYGTLDGALRVLTGLVRCVEKHMAGYDWNSYDFDNLYLCW